MTSHLILFVILTSSYFIAFVDSHGMVMDPVNRASRWRFDPSAPVNYDDAASWCGGLWTQHGMYGGKCGICGDSYGDVRPRKHELGGLFGQGVIVKSYESNSVVTVDVKVTVNHKGYFWFDLCNLDGKAKEEETCFTKLLTVDEQEKWYLSSLEVKTYQVQLKLPNVSCQHCVLRWTYVAGNNWGVCEDGSQGLGCGPQEHFRTCSDIAIVSLKSQHELEIPKSLDEIEDNAV